MGRLIGRSTGSIFIDELPGYADVERVNRAGPFARIRIQEPLLPCYECRRVRRFYRRAKWLARIAIEAGREIDGKNLILRRIQLFHEPIVRCGQRSR